jgi:hypothetical protein
MVNLGNGPLIIKATRFCPDCPEMGTRQVIRRSDGTKRVRRTAARERYETDDGHNHWHVRGMESYRLYPLAGPAAGGPRLGHKYGFCFFDGVPYQLDRARAPQVPRFRFWDCGTPSSQSLTVGLSVGWGDIYPWDFGGQFIDASSAPSGGYLLCLTADPSNWFRERADDNNQSWARIRLRGSTVTVMSTGLGACQDHISYPIEPGGDPASEGSAGLTALALDVASPSAAGLRPLRMSPTRSSGASAPALCAIPGAG